PNGVEVPASSGLRPDLLEIAGIKTHVASLMVPKCADAQFAAGPPMYRSLAPSTPGRGLCPAGRSKYGRPPIIPEQRSESRLKAIPHAGSRASGLACCARSERRSVIIGAPDVGARRT